MDGLDRPDPVLRPTDPDRTLGDLQARGTHNSYHIAPDNPLDSSWAYTQPSLTDQLQLYGVRQLELDLHLADDGHLDVFHLPAVDDQSNCGTFSACLTEICIWSVAHSSHAPILVWLEPKDDVDGANGYQSLLGHTSAIDAEIRDIFEDDQLYTPDDWLRTAPDLGTSTASFGPPTLSHTRGTVLFAYLDSGEHRDDYLSESLSGRVMFPDTDGPTDSFAALVKDASPEALPALLAAGLVVTSNVDNHSDDDATNTASRDAELAAGVNYAATDFPVPTDTYWMDLPDSDPLRCNPVTAPTDCLPADLEVPGL
jgi:hypothetical protein